MSAKPKSKKQKEQEAAAARERNRQLYCYDLVGVQAKLGGRFATGLFLLWREVSAPLAGKKETFGQYHLSFVDGQGYPQLVFPDRNPWHEIHEQLEALDRGKDPTSAAPIPVSSAQCEMERMAEGGTYEIIMVAHPDAALAMTLLAFLEGGEAPKESAYDFKGASKRAIRITVEGETEDGARRVVLDLPQDKDKFWPGGDPDYYGGWLLYRDMPYAHFPEVRDAVDALCTDLSILRYPTGHQSHFPYPKSGDDGAEVGTLKNEKPETRAHRRPNGRFGGTVLAAVHAFQKDAVADQGFRTDPKLVESTPGIRKSWAYLIKGRGVVESPVLGLPDIPIKPAAAVADAVGVDLGPLASSASAAGASPAVSSAKPKREGPPKESEIAPGVVDAVTAAAIESWKVRGLRKPGDVLVALGHGTWGRLELACSIWAWDLLAKKLGVPYGVVLGSTFRELLAPGGNGASLHSNHKHGLSVDLSCNIQDKGPQANATRRPGFPVVYEGNWYYTRQGSVEAKRLSVVKQSKAQEAAKRKLDDANASPTAGKARLAAARKDFAKADAALAAATRAYELALADKLAASEAEAKPHFTMLWRLFGHSELDPWSTSPAELRKDLGRRLGEAASEEYGIVKEYRALMMGKFPKDLPSDYQKEAEAVIAPHADRLAAAVKELLSRATPPDDKGTPPRIVGEFFRPEVTQWAYDPWEPRGGQDEDTPRDPGRDGAALGLKVKAHSWLNLTRLGYLLGMWRITAIRSEFKRKFENPEVDVGKQTYNLSLGGKVVFPTEKYKGKVFKQDLMALANQIKLLQEKVPGCSLTVLLGKAAGGKKLEIPLADFDLAALESWPKIIQDKVPKTIKFDGMDVLVSVSADKATREATGQFLKEYFKQFQVLEVGKRLNTTLEKNVVVTAETLVKALLPDDILESPSGSAPKQSEGTTAKAGKQKPRLTSSTKIEKDWRIGVRVPLAKDAPMLHGAVVRVPNPGIPRALEWWHYDCYARGGKTWGGAAQVIGYSEDALGSPAAAPPDLSGIIVRGGGFETTRHIVTEPGEPENEKVE